MLTSTINFSLVLVNISVYANICFLSDFSVLLPSQSLFHQFVFIMKYFLDPLNGNVSVCGPWHQTVWQITIILQDRTSSDPTKLTQRDLKIIISLNGLSRQFNLYFFYWQLENLWLVGLFRINEDLKIWLAPSFSTDCHANFWSSCKNLLVRNVFPILKI